MTSPPWPQNKPSCQGASRKIWHKVQGNPFLDVVIVPSLKADLQCRGDTFNKYQSTGCSNPSKSQSNYLGSCSKNGGGVVPLTRRDVSQTLRVHSVLENSTQILSIVSGYKIVFLKIPFQKSPPFTQASGQEALLTSQEDNKFLQKGAIHKTFLPETVFTTTCFLYPKGEDLCIR